MPTLPHTLLAFSEILEPMVASMFTIWLLLTVVLFMVVTSIRLPAAAPWAATLPPTVSTLTFRLDQLFCWLSWLLLIWLPIPPCDGMLFQVPYCGSPVPSASEGVANRNSRTAAKTYSKYFMVRLLKFWLGR